MIKITFFYVGRKYVPFEPKLKKLVRAISARFKLTRAKISIAVVDNKKISSINRRFLNRKTPTDCIAFDLSDLDYYRHFELVVNGQKAVAESRKRQHPALAELALYITHGLLHVLGFDDAKPSQAKIMHRLEDEILEQEGFGPVYFKGGRFPFRKRRKK